MSEIRALDGAARAEDGAIHLSEYLLDLNQESRFLQQLSPEVLKRIRQSGVSRKLARGETLFRQGDAHTGVWIVETGRIRSYFVGPSGREITLAHWTPGHFVGGPEVFGRGRQVWSGDALEASRVLFLSGTTLRGLVLEIPDVALAVIDGLVAKGKCYSALIQMLGTRSVFERLQQLLLSLAVTIGRHEEGTIVIERSLTYDQIASMVGATRQWVTQSLEKMQVDGIVVISRQEITILDMDRLAQ